MKCRWSVWLLSVVVLAMCSLALEGSEPWQAEGPTGAGFYSLTVAPDGTLLAGTGGGLYQFSEVEERWEFLSLEMWDVNLVFASSAGVLFAHVSRGGCMTNYDDFVSFDGGHTWDEVNGISTSVRPTAIVETPDGKVWMGLSSGDLYRWDSDGARWKPHFPAISTASVVDLVATSDGVLLELANTFEYPEMVVLRSDDGGATWSTPLVSTSGLSALAAGRGGFVVAAGRGPSPGTITFYFSSDDGNSWQEQPCVGDACSAMMDIYDLVILDDGTVAAAVRDTNGISGRLIVSDRFDQPWRLAARYSYAPSELFEEPAGAFWVVGFPYAWRSTNGAASFEHVTHGLIETCVTSLAEAEGNILAVVGSWFVGGWAGLTLVPGISGVHISLDGGATWDTTSVWQANQVFSGITGAVLAATDYGVQRSLDGGITWSTVAGTNDLSVETVAEDQYGTICLISTETGLSCSEDNGTSWHGDLELGPTDKELAVTPDGTYFVEAKGAVYRSTDRGHNWWQTPLSVEIKFFGVDPDGAVYAPVDGSDEVAVSHDLGLSWEIIQTPSLNPVSIAFHSRRGMVLGNGYVVYYSSDRYATWKTISLPARSLLVDGDHLIGGGGSQGGVWHADFPSRIRRYSGRTRP